MADERLIFPLGFDMESGVKEIQKDWPGYYKKLQKMVDKTPLKIKLKLDAKGLDLSALKDYEKVSAKAALAAKRLADVEAKQALVRKRNSDARVAEATEEARIAQKKAQSELTQLRLNDAIKNGVSSSNALTGAYSKQSTYLSRLVQRMGLYFGIHQFASILRNVRETTAEFELQRVSLGALIQDAYKADVLFSQIKAAAVESPYQIKELVNYTKQLAAYGVQSEKLFSNVMQYADVAAGLGADMSRVILAMGQIRAAGVLKGTELRQLTELGIPMVDLLSKKLTDLRGTLVTTGEVFSMISDKAISFNMVQEVFDDLTSAGGRFYNMQKKQAETLAGQWSNLKDTISIAYDEIGNTDTVRSTMEWWISVVKNLAENWRGVAAAIVGMAATAGVIKTLNNLLALYTANANSATAAQARLTGAIKAYRGASKGGAFMKILATQALWSAQAMRKAAQATNMFAKAWHKLVAAISGNWITMVIAAVAALVVHLVNARQKANELNNELSNIGAEGDIKMAQSVRNFERLAKIVVNSVDGTKKQTEALKELQRTYGDIIPVQDISIEKLHQMKGNYEAVTQAIREKIAMQTLEQKINAINEDYGNDIAKQQKKFKEYLEQTAGLSSEEAIRVIANIQKQIAEGAITAGYEKGSIFGGEKGLKKAIAEEVFGEKDFDPLTGYQWDNFSAKIVKDLDESYKDFVLLNIEMEKAIQSVTKEMNASTGTLGKYQEAWEVTNKAIGTSIGKITTYKNTKLYDEEVEKVRIKEYADFLRKTVGAEMKTIQSSTNLSDEEKKLFDIEQYIGENKIDLSKLLDLEGLSEQARMVIEKVSKELQGMEQWRETIQSFSRDITIGDISRKIALYTDEEISNFGDLKTALVDVQKKYKEYTATVAFYARILKTNLKPAEREHIEDQLAMAEELKRQAKEVLNYFNTALTTSSGGGSSNDPWLNRWKNRLSLMKDFQRGVETLSKKMLELNAIERERDIMRFRATSVGMDVNTLTGSPEELSKWYDEAIQEVKKKINSYSGFKGLDIGQILMKSTKNKKLKSYIELLQTLLNEKTDFDTKQLENKLKKKIDQLAENVSRSREAQDFYQKMLGMTGNEELATNLTVSVYGGIGDDLQSNLKKQLTQAFEGVDISKAFSEKGIDWGLLNDLVENIPVEEMRERARKLVKAGLDDETKWLLDLYKTYEKFQTYEERRTAVMAREAQKRKEIEASSRLSPEEKKKQTKASEKREAQELDTIDLEELKASDDWIQTFENVDKVGTKSIQHLMGVLKEFINTNKDLTPEQLKTLMSEYEKLYEGLIARNPLKAITDGTKEYFKASKDLRIAKKDENLKKAREEEKDAQKSVTEARIAVRKAPEEERVAATENLAKAEERLAKAQSKRSKAENAVRKAQDKQRTALNKVHKGVNEAATAYNALGEVVNGVMETFNVDETSNLGIALKSVSQSLTMVAGVLGIINAIITLIESHPLVLAISAGIMAIVGAIMLFKNLKTADAEAKIEAMTKKLEELEHAYERLEKAQEKAFGADYIETYRQRMANLRDQEKAYLAQAEAERWKGKDADEQAIKDYEKSAQDAADNIMDAQTEIAEHFLGTDLSSAARDFAQAWIDAYKEFGSTTDAIKERFSEMIENMIVESLAAKVIQGQMQDIFDTIGALSKDGQISVSDAAHIAELSKVATQNIDVGMNNLMNALAAAGLSVRGMGSDLTGISKDLATASEESILGLAAGINTQNFYISQVPPKLDTIIAILQGGANPAGAINVQDLITIQNQHLAYLPNIATNTLNTADRCERAALACESALSKISSVISLRGTTSSHVVNTN